MIEGIRSEKKEIGGVVSDLGVALYKVCLP